MKNSKLTKKELKAAKKAAESDMADAYPSSKIVASEKQIIPDTDSKVVKKSKKMGFWQKLIS